MSECVGAGCTCNKPYLKAREDGKVRCVDVASGYEMEFSDEKSANDSNVFENGQWSLSQTETPITRPELKPIKQYTKKEIKKYNHDFVTRRLPIVKECGHKFNPEQEPRLNCEWCWFAYFNTNGEIAKLADEIYQKEGKEVLIRIKGERFVKFFKRFMGTVCEFVKHQKEISGDNRTTGEMATIRESAK